jgi:hypothetical protein
MGIYIGGVHLFAQPFPELTVSEMLETFRPLVEYVLRHSGGRGQILLP